MTKLIIVLVEVSISGMEPPSQKERFRSIGGERERRKEGGGGGGGEKEKSSTKSRDGTPTKRLTRSSSATTHTILPSTLSAYDFYSFLVILKRLHLLLLISRVLHTFTFYESAMEYFVAVFVFGKVAMFLAFCFNVS